jgi:hypothetical protein
MQLCLYQYVVQSLPEFWGYPVETGIWSFADAKKGVVSLEFAQGNLDDAMVSIQNLILEILNPEISFLENVKTYNAN